MKHALPFVISAGGLVLVGSLERDRVFVIVVIVVTVVVIVLVFGCCRSEAKVLFSASVDSTIVQWSASFEPYHSVEVCACVCVCVCVPLFSISSASSSTSILMLRVLRLRLLIISKQRKMMSQTTKHIIIARIRKRSSALRLQ